MNKYTAVYHKEGSTFVNRITSISADSYHAAIERLSYELQKPGRRHIYDQWVAEGACVIENDNANVVIKGVKVK